MISLLSDYTLMKYFSRQIRIAMEDQIDLSAFEHTTKDEWTKKIESELKGKSADALTWTSYDGKTPVFLTKEDLANNPFSDFVEAAKRSANKWSIELDYTTETEAFYNTLNGEGIDALNVDATLVKGKELKHLPIGSSKEIFLDNIADFDALPVLNDSQTLKGLCWKDNSMVKERLGELFAARKAIDGGYSLACANGLQWSNKGAYISQELAFALAEGHDLLVSLMQSGHSVDEVSDCIQFKMGIGNSFFKEIAKFRALRALWSSIVEAYEPKNEKSGQTKIRAYNSTWNKTAIDEQTNLLRTTTEAMSAIMGGVDTLNVLPYNAITKPTAEAYRWSRNTQLMLRDESFLNRVIDPGSGSYFIEDWSKQIADKAWAIFQDIEDKGGYFTCLENGMLEELCAAAANEQVQLVESGDRVVIGANAFRAKDSDKPIRGTEKRLASSVEEDVVSTEKG